MRIQAIVFFILFSSLSVSCASYQPIRFKSAPVGEDSLVVKGKLYKPEGEGPFPAVIVLHGCGGVDYHHVNWANQLVDWGYVALIVDSFGPRNVKKVCGKSYKVSPIERASDAYGAAIYLMQLPYVSRENIGLIGFSHGGLTGIKAIQTNFKHSAKMEEMPFKTAVLFYPWCDSALDQDIDIPTLIFIGDKDDWTPASRCVELKKWVSKPDRVKLVVYENAYHCFDRPKGYREYSGHILKYDDTATKDAKERTKEFFDQYLLE